MFGWLRRAFSPAAPQSPRHGLRLTQLENLTEELESRIDFLATEIKKIRGRQFALEKRAQDDVGDEIDERAEREALPIAASRVTSTAHLARRFKGG